MALIQQNDIPYHLDPSNDPFREFDLYYHSFPVKEVPFPPLICFVHGGAWRSEDKCNHSDLARNLVSQTSFPVVVPNYRLSQKGNGVVHPVHAQDVLQFLHFITSNNSTLPPVFDPHRIYLIGHSCSAHMLASILLDTSATTPVLTPSPVLLDAVQGVILSEGIYDIDLLLNDFPNYRSWFIADAFGDMPSYAAFNVAALSLRNLNDTKWLIIHSTGDTLVNNSQSQAMLDHLRALYRDTDTSHLVQGNMKDLNDEHDALLSTTTYLHIVKEFIEARVR
ncbi:hypothetical protein GYMLUDRAFT_44226 [Collybiopsis luxurians FD-317 M1]|uniref:Unplaced genomic scaffold GYMLUscaffold_30, whole genome shotgun sequence n=1 Tax=Collybiopsis luxurians FD-317 M1 TaxID=944289 RepID=A0A0D0CV15_9AGAR|nr:hypothetical protein GYMLUDRAFT_44226 [Collybiopsis luxurians FD-317 M1]